MKDIDEISRGISLIYSSEQIIPKEYRYCQFIVDLRNKLREILN